MQRWKEATKTTASCCHWECSTLQPSWLLFPSSESGRFDQPSTTASLHNADDPVSVLPTDIPSAGASQPPAFLSIQTISNVEPALMACISSPHWCFWSSAANGWMVCVCVCVGATCTSVWQSVLSCVSVWFGVSASHSQLPTSAHNLLSLHKGTIPNHTLPLCYLNWLLHPAPTTSQDGLEPLQLTLVVSISTKTSLALAVHHLQLALMAFFLYQLAHLLTCTSDLQCCHYPPPIALAVVFPLPTRDLLMSHIHTSTLCNLHCVVVVV